MGRSTIARVDLYYKSTLSCLSSDPSVSLALASYSSWLHSLTFQMYRSREGPTLVELEASLL